MTDTSAAIGIELRLLRTLNPADIRRLNVGYTSTAIYRVNKSETHERMLVTLELVELEQPLGKQWNTDDEELVLLQRAVQEGLSLGAYHGDQMVGIAIIETRRWNRSLWVWELHVAEEYRGRGIGTRLMQAVIETARQSGLRAVALETQSTNMPAICFYRKCGFVVDGLDLSFYTNDDVQKDEVALFMKYKL